MHSKIKKSGKDMVISDYLSRNPVFPSDDSDPISFQIQDRETLVKQYNRSLHIGITVPNCDRCDEISHNTAQDERHICALGPTNIGPVLCAECAPNINRCENVVMPVTRRAAKESGEPLLGLLPAPTRAKRAARPKVDAAPLVDDAPGTDPLPNPTTSEGTG